MADVSVVGDAQSDVLKVIRMTELKPVRLHSAFAVIDKMCFCRVEGKLVMQEKKAQGGESEDELPDLDLYKEEKTEKRKKKRVVKRVKKKA